MGNIAFTHNNIEKQFIPIRPVIFSVTDSLPNPGHDVIRAI